MKNAKRVVLGLVAGALLSAMIPATVAVATTDSPCWKVRDAERSFAQKINGARDNAGVGNLNLDPELSKAARKHTKSMKNQDELYHTPGNKLADRVTNWTILGENVGVGGNVDSLHQAFMNSPGHKANIVYGAFKHVGVGVKEDKSGDMWVTVIFEAQTNPGTSLNMPDC